jgi:DNA replication protein DnaC
VYEWADGKQPGLVMFGDAGLGKTALGVALLRQLAADCVGGMHQWNMVTHPDVIRGWESGEDPRMLAPCWFERFSHLLRLQRRQSWDEEGWFEQLQRDVRVLMLDDIGVDAGTPFRESFLLSHIDWMFDTKARLILTTNARPEHWKAAFGPRINDRLLDSRWFLKIPFSGPTLR